MNLDEIQHWILQARPGTTIQIVSIQIPVDAPLESEIAPRANECERPWSIEQILEWVRREYGEEGLKPREWSALLPGVSTRELKQAVRTGGIRHHRKAEGRDHGAYLISPGAICEYLQCRPKAEAGLIPTQSGEAP